MLYIYYILYTHMLHVWSIYIQNRVILFVQMLGFIFHTWSIWDII